ncbi:MAG: hypothetical protein ABW250_26825 [Pyrinomonadaceae bacterium]
MTGKLKPYACAIVALRPDPFLTKFIDGKTGKVQLFFDGDEGLLSCVDFSPEISVNVHVIFAESEAEAIDAASEKVKKDYPEGEGWIYAEKSCRAWPLDSLIRPDSSRAHFVRPGDAPNNEPAM